MEVRRIGAIGPALPPDLKLNKSDTEDSSSSSSDSEDEQVKSKADFPDHSSGSGFYGPVVPAGLVKSQTQHDPLICEPEEDDNIIGPAPHTGPKVNVSASEEFEQRAQRMRDKLLNQVHILYLVFIINFAINYLQDSLVNAFAHLLPPPVMNTGSPPTAPLGVTPLPPF